MATDFPYCTGGYCHHLSADLGGDEHVHEFQERLREGELDGFEGDVIDFVLRVLESPHDVPDADFKLL